MNKSTFSKIFVIIIGLLALTPYMESAWALLAGVFIALTIGNPFQTKKWVHPLLGLSVAGLGAGMNLMTVARVGFEGLGTTFLSIAFVCVLGFFLMKIFQVEKEIGILVTLGTAICGGSAIAAITPVIRAKHHSVSVALGTVFILNALALIVFPTVGHSLNMSEHDFGLWSALAIHDTSSVVGATVGYGKVAAEVGTTVKLARALWIVPITLLLGMIFQKSKDPTAGPAKKPWFIAWFLIAAALVTWIPELQTAGHWVEFLAKRLLVLTLFLIGLGLSRETIKTVGIRPMLMGVALWIITASVSLALIQAHII